MMTKTVWRKAVYKNLPPHRYEVSNTGLIRNRLTNRVLNPSLCNGYVKLRTAINYRKVSFYVHRIIVNTFIGKFTKKLGYVNHINGIRNDNRIENLELTSYSLNQIHKYRVLKRVHYSVKLTRDDASEIRIKYKTGEFTHQQLADKYKVGHTLIGNIINNKTRSYN